MFSGSCARDSSHKLKVSGPAKLSGVLAGPGVFVRFVLLSTLSLMSSCLSLISSVCSCMSIDTIRSVKPAISCHLGPFTFERSEQSLRFS